MSGRSARVTNPKTGVVRTTSTESAKPVRSFICISVNGRKFTSRALRQKPNSAASSMFSQWCRKKSKQGYQKARVLLRETTRNSLQKEYAYEITRIKREDDATPVVKENVPILYRFNYSVKSIDRDLARRPLSSKKKKSNKKKN